MSQSSYEAVTFRIIEALKQGVIPWRKPWDAGSGPINALTKRPYRGINVFLLSCSAFHDHRWVTFRQARELGGYVQPGQSSSLVTFWMRWQPESDDDKEPRRSIPILKHYHVFNVEQCSDLKLEPLPGREKPVKDQKIKAAERLIAAMPDPPGIMECGQSAWYRPRDDQVGMPRRTSFKRLDDFYATLFHELAHATGHERRLGRKGIMDQIVFGSGSYGQEELVAEFASAFLCQVVGLDNSLIDGAASYIDHWLSVLRHDPKAIVFGASNAQKAADFIRNLQPEPPLEAA